MRQCCNVAYSLLAEGRTEDELEKLHMALGMVTDPEEEALAALRAHQQAAGIRFENPDAPVAPPPDAEYARDEEFR